MRLYTDYFKNRGIFYLSWRNSLDIFKSKIITNHKSLKENDAILQKTSAYECLQHSGRLKSVILWFQIENLMTTHSQM